MKMKSRDRAYFSDIPMLFIYPAVINRSRLLHTQRPATEEKANVYQSSGPSENGAILPAAKQIEVND